MKCARVGCGLMATKKPVLSFGANGLKNSPRVEAQLHLGVCTEHASTDTEMWLTDAGWLQLKQSMRSMRLGEPDRSSVRVDFIELN